MAKSSIERLRFCNFKLRTLLNITQAINLNLPTEDLLFTFKQILSEELNIGRFLLFSNLEKKWEVILAYGIEKEEYEKINIKKDLIPLQGIEILVGDERELYQNLDFVIPIFKENKVIAYMLLGDIDDEEIGISPSLRHLQFIQTLSNIILVAIQNKELLKRSFVQERIKKELEMAANIQSMLVPSSDSMPQINGVRIKPFYMPHYEVGGDLYDFGSINKNEVYFCIADVSGKGMSGAMIMANFQANLRAQLRIKNIPFTHIVKNLNQNVLNASKGQHFVTMFLAKYNIFTKQLLYINAGHLPPFLFDLNTQKVKHLTLGCVGLGMLDEIEQVKIGKIRIKNTSKLLCFTDGLSEYSADGVEELGLLIATEAMQNQGLDIVQSIDYIIQKLNISKENKNIFDDVTMLGVQFDIQQNTKSSP